MIIVATALDLKHALDSPLCAAARNLLQCRAEELTADGVALEDRARFIVVEPGDSAASVTTALGFSPFLNLVNGSTFGEVDFAPSFEWALDHGGVFEAPFVMSDDGFGWVLLVLDQSDVDHRLLAMLRERAVRPQAVPV